MTQSTTFSRQFPNVPSEILERFDTPAIDRAVSVLAELRRRYRRLFIFGVCGSAANASHAVSDVRKIAGFDAYAPTDDVSDLSARTNDEGWGSISGSWLRVGRLRAEDAILVLSVGGNLEKHVHANPLALVRNVMQVGVKVIGIVGRDGACAGRRADACILIPPINPVRAASHAEVFQAVAWHLVVSHPDLKAAETMWESLQ
jgi:D-sedoheptulose 7-phosphate isomerase